MVECGKRIDPRPHPKSGKKSCTVFLDPEDLQFLKDRCRETGQATSAVIRQIVKEYIRRERSIDETRLRKA